MNKLALLLAILFVINIVSALPNPAAVYCTQMGYTYNIIKTPKGESGQCAFPDNSKCDEWDFFKGKCGNTYSYCVKNGYDIKTMSDGNNSYSPEYAVCVPKKKGQVQISVTDVLKNTMNIRENLTINASENKTISVNNLVPNTGGGGIKINMITSTGTEIFQSATGIETCSDAFEGQTITLACRNGYVITRVWYTLYLINESSTTCNYPFASNHEDGYADGNDYLIIGHQRSCTYNYNSNCVGRNSCSFTASNTNCGGDPDPNKPKRLVAIYECSSSLLPSTFDWRNVNASNWMTPVKDQGKCGSCWAFAAVGAVEAQKKIEYNTPTTNSDLSEQDLVSCSGPYIGDCNGGFPEYALDYMEGPGVVDEACFPYTGCKNYTYDNSTKYYNCNEEYACARCSGWQNKLQKIGGYNASPYPYYVVISENDPNINYTYKGIVLFSPNPEKYISENGPVLALIDMRSGHFVNGVYTGCDYSGYDHAVVLVGYNRTGNYWIAKNSWGSTWNGDGYFKIDYNAQGSCWLFPVFNIYAKPDTCVDTNPYANTPGWSATLVKSNISGLLHEAPYFYSDYCLNSTTVIDYWCNWYAYVFFPGQLSIGTSTYDCTYLGSFSCSDGACRPQPAAALKGGPNGQLYVPNLTAGLAPYEYLSYNYYLKVDLWCNMSDTNCQSGKCGCTRMWCDQAGGKSPYPTIKFWPDGNVDGTDSILINRKFGTWEGSTGWDYMADCVLDRNVDGTDGITAARNFGQGPFNYSTDLANINVLFDTGDVGYPDANGYIKIPSESMNLGLAENFTVYNGSKPVMALVTFYNSSILYQLAPATKPSTQVQTTALMAPTVEMPVGNTWTMAVVLIAIIGLVIGYFVVREAMFSTATRKSKKKQLNNRPRP